MKDVFISRCIATASLSFALFSASPAQSIPPTWLSVYDGDGHGVDISSALVTDRAGNVYITGRSDGVSSGQDFVTLKYSRHGERLLTLRYNGGGNSWDEGNALVVDDSGNVYAGGTSFLSSSRSEAIIVKYSPSGAVEWEAHYSPTDTNASATIARMTLDRSTGTLVAGGASRLLRITTSGRILSVFFISNDSGTYRDTSYTVSDLATGSDGVTYVAGTKAWWPEGGDVPAENSFTLRLDRSDSVVWMRTFPAYGGKSLQVDREDNVIVTTGDPVSILKYDVRGELRWYRSYPRLDDPFAVVTDLKIDSMDNVYATGYRFHNQTAFDYATVKFDPNGNQMWSSFYDSGDTTRDFASALALDNAGNVYVTGTSMYGYYDSSRCSTVKYDSMGQMIGEVYFSRGRYAGGRFVEVSDSGDMLVGGDLTEHTGSDYFVTRYPADFPPVLDKRSDMFPLSVGREWIFDLDWRLVDPEKIGSSTQFVLGRAILDVTRKTVFTDSTEWLIREIDSTRICRFHSFPSSDTTCEIHLDSTSLVLIERHEGNHRLYRTDRTDDLSFLSSVLPFGNNLSPQAVFRYQQPFMLDTLRFSSNAGQFTRFDFAFVRGVGEIAVACGALYMPSYFSSSNRLESSTVLAVDDRKTVVLPSRYALSQNYPNPFNPSTTFTYTLPHLEHVRLAIFNIIGQEIAVLIDGEKPPGTYTAVWNAASLASGVYFFRLRAGGYEETKKLILAK